MQNSKLERITKFKAAYDKRSTDPKKNFGIHCVQVFMVLKGKKGAVHFTFSTGMYLPETLQRMYEEGSPRPTKMPSGKWWSVIEPMGYDVGYHSPKKIYEGQTVVWPTKTIYPKGEIDWKNPDTKKISQIKFKKIGSKPPKCEWIGRPCYCDGSAIRAETFMNVLLSKGSEEVWKMLEQEYHDTFK